MKIYTKHFPEQWFYCSGYQVLHNLYTFLYGSTDWLVLNRENRIWTKPRKLSSLSGGNTQTLTMQLQRERHSPKRLQHTIQAVYGTNHYCCGELVDFKFTKAHQNECWYLPDLEEYKRLSYYEKFDCCRKKISKAYFP